VPHAQKARPTTRIAQACDAKASAAKASDAKASDAKASGAKASDAKASAPEPTAAPETAAQPGPTRLARDVMTPNPDSINANASVTVAACKMREAGVGALPVRDDGGRFIGMLTDRDITIRVTAEGKNPDTTTVAAAMTRDFVACDEETSIREVGRVMQQHRIRRIPIVKKGEQDPGRPHEIVGIISLGDLATDLQASDVPAETLSAVSEPSAHA
jgi:CBS domain-containing protein